MDLAAVRIQRLKAAAPEAAAIDAEILVWDQVKGSSEITEIQAYLKRYPEGRFADKARDRIHKLATAAREKQNLEVKMWAGIKDSRKVNDFQNFLQAFPDGIFADIAKSRMENLIRVEAQTEELAFWNRIRKSSDPKDYEEYLLRYPKGQYTDHALVIGNNEYRHLTNLKTAVNDAKAVGLLLEQTYGFKVKYLLNAGRKDIIDALSTLRHSLSKRDNLLIYFAGHGWLDKEAGRGYWLPVDSERDSPSNWISTGGISDFLKAMRTKHVMVVADSCYSGTLARAVKLAVPTSQYLRRMAEKRTRVALTSGAVELVLDDGSYGVLRFCQSFSQCSQKKTKVCSRAPACLTNCGALSS